MTEKTEKKSDELLGWLLAITACETEEDARNKVKLGMELMEALPQFGVFSMLVTPAGMGALAATPNLTNSEEGMDSLMQALLNAQQTVMQSKQDRKRSQPERPK